MSEPRICTRNWVDTQTSFVLSHGGTSQYLYDRNDVTQYVTSGANLDSTYCIIEAYFYESGVAKIRSIDTVILKNYNFKEYNVYYWNGAWSNIYGTSNDSQSSRYISLSPVSTTAIAIHCLKTKTANQEKAIGEIITCGTSLACDDMYSYDPKWRERSKEIVLGDGSLHKVYTKDKSGRLSKYEAALKFHYLSKATRDALKAIKDTGEPFLFQPESVTVPEDIYYVHWSNTWDEKYMSNFKSAGYEVVMNLKEV